MKKDIFEKKEKKDLTVSTHYTIKESIILEVKKIAKKKEISESKVVNNILQDFFKK